MHRERAAVDDDRGVDRWPGFSDRHGLPAEGQGRGQVRCRARSQNVERLDVGIGPRVAASFEFEGDRLRARVLRDHEADEIIVRRRDAVATEEHEVRIFVARRRGILVDGPGEVRRARRRAADVEQVHRAVRRARSELGGACVVVGVDVDLVSDRGRLARDLFHGEVRLAKPHVVRARGRRRVDLEDGIARASPHEEDRARALRSVDDEGVRRGHDRRVVRRVAERDRDVARLRRDVEKRGIR